MMGIVTEYNPDLTLRNTSEFKSGSRKKEECLPEQIQEGNIYDFLKEGQRNYWLEGELPLIETKGNQILSRPIAAIIIIETTHFLLNGKPFTKGKYKVTEIFSDDKIHFDGFAKI